jgi:hypothetical protein
MATKLASDFRLTDDYFFSGLFSLVYFTVTFAQFVIINGYQLFLKQGNYFFVNCINTIFIFFWIGDCNDLTFFDIFNRFEYIDYF